MIFLSFGAPDLAMTQFSVETLTVLIYVLVFRHFRGLGSALTAARSRPRRADCRRDRNLHRRAAPVRGDDGDGAAA